MLFMAKMKLAAMVTAAVMLLGGAGVTTYVAVAAGRSAIPAEAPAQAPAPGDPPATSAKREFGSTLSLIVWVKKDAGADWQVLGETPAKQPLAVPDCFEWRVQPRTDRGAVDMAAVAREVERQGVPGLRLIKPLKDADLSHLAGLKGLTSLYLAQTDVTGAGLAHLRVLQSLQTLDLCQTKVTDAGLAHLRKLDNLKTLNLAWSRGVTDMGLVHLKELKGLQTLVLSGYVATDAGLAHIGQIKGLQSLDASHTDVSDAGVVHLKAMKGLRELDITDTRVSPDALKQLQEALPECRIKWGARAGAPG